MRTILLIFTLFTYFNINAQFIERPKNNCGGVKPDGLVSWCKNPEDTFYDECGCNWEKEMEKYQNKVQIVKNDIDTKFNQVENLESKSEILYSEAIDIEKNLDNSQSFESDKNRAITNLQKSISNYEKIISLTKQIDKLNNRIYTYRKDIDIQIKHTQISFYKGVIERINNIKKSTGEVSITKNSNNYSSNNQSNSDSNYSTYSNNNKKLVTLIDKKNRIKELESNGKGNYGEASRLRQEVYNETQTKSNLDWINKQEQTRIANNKLGEDIGNGIIAIASMINNDPEARARRKARKNKTTTESNYIEGISIIKKKNKYGFMDENKNIIIPPQYGMVSLFQEGVSAVTKLYPLNSSAKWFYIDNTNTRINSYEYESAYSYVNGEALVRIKDNYHTINKEGVIVYSFKNFKGTNINLSELSFKLKNLILVKNNKKYGWIDKKGNIIIPIKYELWKSKIRSTEGYVPVKLNGKKFYINNKGECVKHCK